MAKCRHCGGTFKNSTKEYIIETRHMLKPKMTIENLPVEECSICGAIEIPKSSEQIIQILRNKLRREMENMVQSEEVTEEIPSSEPAAFSASQGLKNLKKYLNRFTS